MRMGFQPCSTIYDRTLATCDERLCRQKCSSNNCWLQTKTTSNCKEKSRNCNLQEIGNYRPAGSRDKNSRNCFDLSRAMPHISDISFPPFNCLCEAGLCSLAPVCSAPYKSDHRAINNSGVADNKSISSHPRRLLHHCPAERRRDWECGGGARWRPLGQCLRRQGCSRLFFFFF